MKNFLKEFKQFAMRGNVIDLAVGVMIGAAFQSIVASLVNNILTPLISSIFRIDDFSTLRILLLDRGESSVYLNYGTFLQSVINFILVALCIFLIVKTINRLKKEKPKPEEEPKLSSETIALNKIISLLEEKNGR